MTEREKEIEQLLDDLKLILHRVKWLVKYTEPKKGRQTIINEITSAYLGRLVMDGRITINKPDSPRDIKLFLISTEFLKWKQNLHESLQT